jgi:Ca-activated chloride channel family protein
MIRFAHPVAFLLLVLVLAYLLFLIRSSTAQGSALVFSATDWSEKLPGGPRARLRHVPVALRVAALVLLIGGLARPQLGRSETKVETEGVDIVLVLDVSNSMSARDLGRESRLDTAKQVAADFIRGRATDRIGLVLFAGKSFTLDYGVLLALLERVKLGMIEDGTALGMAVANGINRLRYSNAKSKVLVLLTDGINNRGEIDPLTAAQMAQTMGIRIHAVGVGSKAPSSIRGLNLLQPGELDEETLQDMAGATGGIYRRATDASSLAAVFEQISGMEKTPVESKVYQRYTELFFPFVVVAGCLFLGDLLLGLTWLRGLP